MGFFLLHPREVRFDLRRLAFYVRALCTRPWHLRLPTLEFFCLSHSVVLRSVACGDRICQVQVQPFYPDAIEDAENRGDDQSIETEIPTDILGMAAEIMDFGGNMERCP